VVVKLKQIAACVPPPTATSPPTPTAPPATPTTTPTPPPGSTPTTPRPSPNTLVIAYDGWTGTYLPAYVLKLIFEDELGYTVHVSDQSTIPAAFESVASGRTDMFTSAWFPGRDFTFARYPDLVKLGQVYGGKAQDAYEGWMVPIDISERFNLTHVRDLKNPVVAQALDTDGDGKGNLIGCPSDWVCANRHPEILSDYDLAELYEIDQPGSEDELLGSVANLFRQGKPALFYMFQPVGFPRDVPVMERAVWLRGTRTYMPAAFNRTIAKGDLIVRHPKVAKVLTNYRIPGQDISEAMTEIGEQGASPQLLTQLARTWIEGHRAEVDSWLEGIDERSPSPAPPPDVLTIAYSPEKEDLFLKLAIEFNLSRPRETPAVHPIRVEMRNMLPDAVDGRFAAMSPDSSVWLPQLDRMWQQRTPGASSLVATSTEYALSPIVIAMLETRAKEMGYPDQAIGWQDLMGRVSEDPTFRWSHPSASTASGLLATTAEFYEGAGKLANLTRADVEAQATLDYVKTIESTVERYGGESEDKVVIRMLAEGGRPLDAFVAQEQLVIYFNRNTVEEKLVAVYPEEGTFWMDHPLVLLNGGWVTERQKEAFRQFGKFVVELEQQRLVERGSPSMRKAA